jgi:hypothetical protein
MTGVRRSAFAALLVAGVLPLMACAGTAADAPSTPSGIDLDGFDPAAVPGNGLWLQHGAAAAAEVVRAARAADTVTYSGSFTELTAGTPEVEPAPGRTLAVQFAGGSGNAAATISTGDLQLELILADGRTYVRGNAAYAAHVGIPQVEQGYVCSVGASALLEEWAPLLSPADLVESLLEGAESVAVESPVGDAPTVELVVGASESPVGALTVERTGAPLPVAFVAGDSTGDGTFQFSGWGDPVDVSPPADPVVACS